MSISTRIEATISLADSVNTDWDVVVVGAGPAGSMTALQSARKGLQTLLLDRAQFPRWKVCGCCLNGLALQALEHANLTDTFESLRPPKLDQVTIAARKSTATLDLPTGRAISRNAFDAQLIESAIQAGVAFLPNAQAQWVPPTKTHALVEIQDLKSKVTIRAKSLVAADGLIASFTRQIPHVQIKRAANSLIGAGSRLRTDSIDYQRGVIYLGVGDAGYVGLVRLEDDTLDVAAAIRPAALRQRQSLGEACATILRESGLPIPPKLMASRWQGTPPLTRTHRVPPTPRLFVIGDAADYVEPFTGEGMAWALSSAIRVPEFLEACVQGDANAARQWPQVRRKLLGLRQWRCRLLTSGLRSPRMTQIGLSLVSRMPALANPYVKLLNQA